MTLQAKDEQFGFRFPVALVYFDGIEEKPNRDLPFDFRFLGKQGEGPTCLLVAGVATRLDAMKEAGPFIVWLRHNDPVAGPFNSQSELDAYLSSAELVLAEKPI